MAKPSLHAQTQAVDVAALQATRRGSPAMKPKQWEHLEPGLKAATTTLLLVQVWRDRLAAAVPEFIREVEGGL
jgi:hypothetical protein